jgi:hypothetical protein
MSGSRLNVAAQGGHIGRGRGAKGSALNVNPGASDEVERSAIFLMLGARPGRKRCQTRQEAAGGKGMTMMPPVPTSPPCEHWVDGEDDDEGEEMQNFRSRLRRIERKMWAKMDQAIIVIRECEYKTKKEQEQKIKAERAKHPFGPEPLFVLMRDFSEIHSPGESAAHTGRARNCEEMK